MKDLVGKPLPLHYGSVREHAGSIEAWEYATLVNPRHPKYLEALRDIIGLSGERIDGKALLPSIDV